MMHFLTVFVRMRRTHAPPNNGSHQPKSQFNPQNNSGGGGGNPAAAPPTAAAAAAGVGSSRPEHESLASSVSGAACNRPAPTPTSSPVDTCVDVADDKCSTVRRIDVDNDEHAGTLPATEHSLVGTPMEIDMADIDDDLALIDSSSRPPKRARSSPNCISQFDSSSNGEPVPTVASAGVLSDKNSSNQSSLGVLTNNAFDGTGGRSGFTRLPAEMPDGKKLTVTLNVAGLEQHKFHALDNPRISIPAVTLDEKNLKVTVTGAGVGPFGLIFSDNFVDRRIEGEVTVAVNYHSIEQAKRNRRRMSQDDFLSKQNHYYCSKVFRDLLGKKSTDDVDFSIVSSGDCSQVQKMLSSMSIDAAIERLDKFKAYQLEGIVAVFTLDSIEKRLPSEMVKCKGDPKSIKNAIASGAHPTHKAFNSLLYRAYQVLVGGESPKLPLSDLKVEDLPEVPASAGNVTKKVEGMTKVPADVMGYIKEEMTSYFRREIVLEEVRYHALILLLAPIRSYVYCLTFPSFLVSLILNMHSFQRKKKYSRSSTRFFLFYSFVTRSWLNLGW